MVDRTLMEEAATMDRQIGMLPYLLIDSITRIILHQIDKNRLTSLLVLEEQALMDLEMGQIIRGLDRVIDNKDSPQPSL